MRIDRLGFGLWVVLCVFGFVPREVLGQSFRDDFTGPDFDPSWELYRPFESPNDPTSPEYSFVSLGGRDFFQLRVDNYNNYDHWTVADRAPQLRRPIADQSAFILETRVFLLAQPTSGSNFHTGLEVVFGPFDIYYWGIYRSNVLRLERSGRNGIFDVPWTSNSAELRIEKVGGTYIFSYRQNDAEPWMEAGRELAVSTPIESVGLIVKTWGGVAVTALFDSFEISLPAATAPTIEPVGDDFALPGCEYSRQLALLEGNPAPTWSVESGPPGLSVDATGRVSGWVPAEGDRGTSVEVRVRAENAEGSDVVSWQIAVEDPDGTPLEGFDSTELDPAWEWYNPTAEPTFSLDESPGQLRVQALFGTAYDHWATVDNAAQLRRTDFDPDETGNFTIETGVSLVPEGGFLPFDVPFHTGLIIHFDQFDVLYWGYYRSNALLRVERSPGPGVGPPAGGALLDTDLGLDPDWLPDGEFVRLRIEKAGDLYRFSYRLEGDDCWKDSGQLTLTDSPIPQSVGLILKTWAGTGAAVTVDFEHFSIRGRDAPPPPVGETFLRMDVTGDGLVNIADILFLLSVFLFGPAEVLACPDAADADDDGRITISDAIFALSFLFLDVARKPLPRQPFPLCGGDPTGDDLNRFAANNTDPGPTGSRDPALGSCDYPPGVCPAE